MGLSSRFQGVVSLASLQDVESGRKSWGFPLTDRVRMGPSRSACGASPAVPHLSPQGITLGPHGPGSAYEGPERPQEALSACRPLCGSSAQVTSISLTDCCLLRPHCPGCPAGPWAQVPVSWSQGLERYAHPPSEAAAGVEEVEGAAEPCSTPGSGWPTATLFNVGFRLAHSWCCSCRGGLARPASHAPPRPVSTEGARPALETVFWKAARKARAPLARPGDGSRERRGEGPQRNLTVEARGHP